MGSKDRKAVGDLCFAFWRLNVFINDRPTIDQVILAANLVGLTLKVEIPIGLEVKIDSSLVTQLNDDELSLKDKLILINGHESRSYYPKELLAEKFSNLNDTLVTDKSSLIWIRNYDLPSEVLQTLTPSEKVDNAYSTGAWQMKENRQFQIQDLGSQFVVSKIHIPQSSKVWDCCCGAAGKSIGLMKQNDAKFYLSDTRESILINAKERLKSHGLSATQIAQIDISQPQNELLIGNEELIHGSLDVIIADVPCSGSGTWFRNPEHFSNFDYDTLPSLCETQIAIVTNALKFLKDGGRLYYITCSVFEMENEQLLKQFEKELNIDQLYYFCGTELGADNMFCAVLSKRQ